MKDKLMNYEIDQNELKKILKYDTETGEFTWLVNRGRNKTAGKIASSAFQSKGYKQVTINNKHYFAHRLAWLYVYGCFPKEQIDHINGIKHDNRICNLREATNSQNQCNQKLRATNSSGYKGVHYFKRANKWQAYIDYLGDRIHLGYFDSPQEASRVVEEKRKILHGEFAYNNNQAVPIEDILSTNKNFIEHKSNS